jgi:Tol biopolymer transport system component
VALDLEPQILKIAAIALALLLALAAIPALRHLREEPPAPPAAVHLSLLSPEGTEGGTGDEPLDVAISPDESTLALVATRDGLPQLFLRRLNERAATPVPGTEGAQLPAWKQTGRIISFFANGRLKIVTVDGFDMRDLAGAPGPEGATWLADGSLLFAGGTPGPIQRLRFGRLDVATTLAPGDQRHVFPVAEAGSDAFVYIAVRQDGRRVARRSAGGIDRDLTTTSGHAVIASNQLLHVRDGTLLAYARDPETGALAPRGTPLALDVGVSSRGRALFTASPRLLLHAPAARRAYELVWLEETGVRSGSAGDVGDYWQVRLSPDDQQVAVTTRDPLLGALDIVLLASGGPGAPERLTVALGADTDPVWSPDGVRVLFRSFGGGRPDLFSRRVQAGAKIEDMLRSELDETPTDWNGERILFHARADTHTDVYAQSTRTAAYQPLLETPFNESDARFSPDGRWIAFVSDESGRPDIYVRQPDGARTRVSFAGGRQPRWTANGRSILFLRGAEVMRADMAAGNRFAPARVLFEARGMRDFDVAHRRSGLLAILPVASAAPAPAISAVLNWSSGADTP